MRIVLLSGASSIHTIRWANGLSEAGHDIHLITQHEPCDPLVDSVKVYQFPNRGILGYFLMVTEVRKLLRQIQPDIVNAHYASGYATTARLAHVRPFVLSVWGSDVYDFPYKSRLHKWLVRKNLLAADVVASTSHCMAEQTRSIAPELKYIAITPFGVDMQLYANAKPLTENNDKIQIGTVKSMASKYGIDTLIESFALLVNKFSNTHPSLVEKLQLRLVGGGPQIDEYKQLAVRLGIGHKVSFLGRVPHQEVPDELAKLDIYVALSRLDSESFGVAIIEAGAARRPVVVSDAGGLPEVTLDGITGVVVPRENPQAAADAIEKLVFNPELRMQMGEAGRKHVSETYGWDVCVETMAKVFESAIEK
ncbi:GDP-mannose-dependent alpha-(1-6)-phosphatidylinositol monomannoside mannosyltransferase [Oligella urethralis]|uniref:glycosyltransferase n=1 Tax=Oligella urethralis TaxID=90245 RepID=UPI000DF87AEE|nr:glycosyltransferase [Oligella urethralis]SUA56873.1 GDP-mannose-dependent alpha-(1-6)-phosphatidylinositol monomannoside mannosyltransferase [Oligella urethralis]